MVMVFQAASIETGAGRIAKIWICSDRGATPLEGRTGASAHCTVQCVCADSTVEDGFGSCNVVRLCRA